MAAEIASLSAAGRMDRMYRHQRHLYDLTRKYYLLGRDRLIDDLAPAAGAGVLEIGCGTGRNLIRAARRYPQARCFGIDVSAAMLATAGRKIARAGLSSRVRVGQADAAGFDALALFGEAKFARIFISYSLSMIPAWRAALRHALSLLTPAGELHVVDFGGQERLPRWFGPALGHWLARFDVIPPMDLERELMICAECLGATLAFRRPYRGYAQLAIFRRRG
jgi:S-adenosylmethionine-diacylgycerolhomoserine-N-methlytransferase